MLLAQYVLSGLHQVEATADGGGEGLLRLQLAVTLRQVARQRLGAGKLALALAAHIQEKVLAHVRGERLQPGGGVVAQEAGEGPLRPVDQLVPVAVRLVLEAPVAGGAEVEELPEALASLQPGQGEGVVSAARSGRSGCDNVKVVWSET